MIQLKLYDILIELKEIFKQNNGYIGVKTRSMFNFMKHKLNKVFLPDVLEGKR